LASIACLSENDIVKLVLTIVCSVLLMGTPFLSATVEPCVKEVKACCSHGKPMPCCAVTNDSSPQNVPTIPVQNNSQENQISLLPAFTAVIWTLPEIPANTIFSATVSSSSVIAAPLVVRNCTFLI